MLFNVALLAHTEQVLVGQSMARLGWKKWRSVGETRISLIDQNHMIFGNIEQDSSFVIMIQQFVQESEALKQLH